jgi:hypothetical protein
LHTIQKCVFIMRVHVHYTKCIKSCIVKVILYTIQKCIQSFLYSVHAHTLIQSTAYEQVVYKVMYKVYTVLYYGGTCTLRDVYKNPLNSEYYFAFTLCDDLFSSPSYKTMPRDRVLCSNRYVSLGCRVYLPVPFSLNPLFL